MQGAVVQHESLAANAGANFLLLQEQKRRKGQDQRHPSTVSTQTFTSAGGKSASIEIYQLATAQSKRFTKTFLPFSYLHAFLGRGNRDCPLKNLPSELTRGILAAPGEHAVKPSHPCIHHQQVE